MKNTKKVEIGIYKNYREYFALGISDYKMREINDGDKYILAIRIRNKLNKEGIKKCFIRPIKNGNENYCFLAKSELEAIANSISFNPNDKNLNVKINEKIYIKKCQTNQ